MNIMPANLAKRSGAAFLDFFMAVLLWLTLVSLVFTPIYSQAFDIPQLQSDYDDIRLATHLYVTDPETELVALVAVDDYPTSIYAYYSDFKDGLIYEGETTTFVFSNEWYNENVLNIGSVDPDVTVYFEYDLDELDQPDPSLVGVPKAATTDAELASFYQTAMQIAHDDLMTYEPFATLVSTINGYAMQIFLIAAAISLTLFYLVFPLLLKNGQTLSKRLFSLGVVTTKGYRIKPWQTIVRFAVFMAEIGLSLYTFFGAILISYTMMIFTKGNRSVHDFAAGTSVINLKGSLVFADEAEAQAYEARTQAELPPLPHDYEPKPAIVAESPLPEIPAPTSSPDDKDDRPE